MRIKIVLILLFSISFLGSSQEGGVYIENHEVTNYPKLPKIKAVQQDEKGLVYFSSNNDIIYFDGTEWRTFQTGSNKLLAVNIHPKQSDKILISLETSIGYVYKNETGEEDYKEWFSIKSKSDQIKQIIISDDHIYFCGLNLVHKFDAEKLKRTDLIKVNSNEANYFIFNNELYNYDQGIVVKISSGSSIKNSDIDFNEKLLFAEYFNQNKLLLGTDKNKLYLFDGQSIKAVPSIGYIKENTLTSGTNYSETHFVLSTLSGGVILVDKSNWSIQNTINYQNNLADDEVSAVYVDKFKGIWIAHRLGVSRANIELPVRNLSVIPGLVGELTSAIAFNNKIYVSTSQGVFVSDHVNDVNDVMYLVKKSKQVKTNIETYTVNRKVSKTIRMTVYKDNGEIDTINTEEIPVMVNVAVDSVVLKSSEALKDSVVRKNYAEASFPFTFKKVKGINTRTKSLFVLDNKVIALTNKGLYQISKRNSSRVIIRNEDMESGVKISDTLMWVSSKKEIFKIEANNGPIKVSDKLDPLLEVSSIAQADGKIYFTHENQLLRINESNNHLTNQVVKNFDMNIKCFNSEGTFYIQEGAKIHEYDLVNYKNINSYKIETGRKNASVFLTNRYDNIWLFSEDQWNLLGKDKNLKISNYIKLFNDISFAWHDGNQFLWVISNNQLFRINNKSDVVEAGEFTTGITGIFNKANERFPLNNIDAPHNNNYMTIEYASPFYLNSEQIQYSYFMKGVDSDWSDWSNETKVTYRFLPHNNLKFQVRAKNIFGVISESEEISISISPPFWKSAWFIILIILLLALALWRYVVYRTQKFERENQILQEKIKEATVEIVAQKDKLEGAYKDIQDKNRNITDSINYAQRIQNAFLPPVEYINEFVEAFVLYRPKSIVSGDFFWFYPLESDRSNKANYFIAAVDCTGHGVPGAMVSTIGNNLLNEIVNVKSQHEPEKVLKEMDNGVQLSLKQDQSKNNDGMDMALCHIIQESDTDFKLVYSGAKRPLVYFEAATGEIHIQKGSRFGVGGLQSRKKEKEYERHEFNLKKGDSIYIFSDGYTDQNDAEREKFSRARLLEIIKEVQGKPMAEQETIFNQHLEDFMQGQSQRDDILLIGYKL